MHKTSDDLATISMISDEITMIFLPWYRCLYSHREMPKVGVANRSRMRIVQNLVEFPPPLIALHPPLSQICKQCEPDIYSYLKQIYICGSDLYSYMTQVAI